ncbi:predicted protein [Naegleria gruberi]|uniref:Predicted protein n=1 Tax=Naegleria gruberi TaxID=5762 RepID=D2VQ71_NAEGR|nr:uncharacterized protein NAEGRDRAFT_71045 [Naegleria gruberi]EFC40995.1 predicted protein [Naegleria gruberi]|eukprot:XP_002673739.1 predicted protein [Naegleria gruberi strain NEG-M]
MTKTDLPTVTSRKDAKNSESNSFSPSTLFSIREVAEMTAYGIFFGAVYGGTRGYLNMRNIKIPTATLDKMRTNLFYRKQMKEKQNLKENPPSPNEFNPNKSSQDNVNTEYDPQSTRVDRKHIILAHLFHQAFRFATNVGLFAFSFSSIDLLLRSKNVFNCYYSNDDEKDENSLKYQIQSISGQIAKVTLTEDQLKTIEENDFLKERVNQLNILHKPIAGTVSGGVFGLLASVPNLFMGIGTASGALSLTIASIGYGLIFGTLSGMCLIPLQSFYMVERFKAYQQVETKKEDEVELALQQEEDGIESELLKEISKKSKVSLQAFINEEETFLNQLEKVSEKIKDIKLNDDEEIDISTRQQQERK